MCCSAFFTCLEWRVKVRGIARARWPSCDGSWRTNMTKRLIAILSAVMVSCIAAISLGAGTSEIANAAEKGDLAALKALIAKKVDVNAPQPDGATALHWAVYRNNLEM